MFKMNIKDTRTQGIIFWEIIFGLTSKYVEREDFELILVERNIQHTAFCGYSLYWVIKKDLKKECDRKVKHQYLGGTEYYERLSLLFQIEYEA